MVRFALQSWHVTLRTADSWTATVDSVDSVDSPRAPDEDVLGLAASQDNLRHEADAPLGSRHVIACLAVSSCRRAAGASRPPPEAGSPWKHLIMPLPSDSRLRARESGKDGRALGHHLPHRAASWLPYVQPWEVLGFFQKRGSQQVSKAQLSKHVQSMSPKIEAEGRRRDLKSPRAPRPLGRRKNFSRAQVFPINTAPPRSGRIALRAQSASRSSGCFPGRVPA